MWCGGASTRRGRELTFPPSQDKTAIIWDLNRQRVSFRVPPSSGGWMRFFSLASLASLAELLRSLRSLFESQFVHLLAGHESKVQLVAIVRYRSTLGGEFKSQAHVAPTPPPPKITERHDGRYRHLQWGDPSSLDHQWTTPRYSPYE